MWRSVLAAVWLSVTMATAPWTSIPRCEVPVAVPVLLYHAIEPGAGGENGAIVAADEFTAQMAWLQANGYTAITTAELGAWLSRKGTLPEKPVLLTFDDGYRSVYEFAYPVLRQHGLRATIFTISGYAGKTLGDLTYLNWAEMQEMERTGIVELQAHTHDGHREIAGIAALRHWTASEIRQDARALQAAFAEGGLERPAAFAYPLGAYDAETLEALAAEGFSLGFTVNHGYVRQGDPPMELNRLIIYPGTSLCRFGELVTGRPPGTCGN